MNPNVLIQEELALVATIDPANVTDTYSDYIDMADFEQVLAIASFGNMSAHTIDFSAYAYTDQAAGNALAIKAITQLAADAGTNDEDQSMISVRKEDLTASDTDTTIAAGGYRYVRFRIVSAGQTGYSSLIVLGKPNYGPSSDYDLASLIEKEDDLT